MKRVLVVCMFLLSACTITPNDEQLKVLSPYGAPSIAFLQMMISNENEINLVNGTDLLISSLVRDQPEYDIVIAPINVGLNLIQNNQSDYRCLAVLTWGNLYIVSENEDFNPLLDDFVAFGKGAVPEKIINVNFNDSAKVEYFPSVLDAQAQLLQNKTEAALLAEPIVSATIQQNNQLKIVVDLQEFYQDKTGMKNYPQAALFVHKESFQDNPTSYYQIVDQMNNYIDLIHSETNVLRDDINELNHEQLGLPKTEIILKALKGMNIDLQYAKDVKEEIAMFMELFGIEISEEMFLE